MINKISSLFHFIILELISIYKFILSLHYFIIVLVSNLKRVFNLFNFTHAYLLHLNLFHYNRPSP